MTQRSGGIFTKKREGNALDDARERQFNVDDQRVELVSITNQGFETGGIRRAGQGESKIAGLPFLFQTLRCASAQSAFFVFVSLNTRLRG